MSFVVTPTMMILAGREYYGDFHQQVNYVLHQIYTTTAVGLRLDPAAWPIGLARKQGLDALLRCTNIVPWGYNTFLVRMCVMHFDSLPATVNDSYNNWLFQKHMAVRYYFHVMDHVADTRIVGNHVLGRKNKVAQHFKYTKNAIVALLIAKCCQGWEMTPAYLQSLHAMEDSPQYQERYYMFVLPFTQFVITEMNPHAHLDARSILEMDMSRAEEYLIKRVRKHGIWSQNKMLHWIQTGEIDRVKHRHVCKGVEFQFARLLSLIVRDYKWPYNQDLMAPEKLYIWDWEQALMYEGYDRLAVARYGVPSFHT